MHAVALTADDDGQRIAEGLGVQGLAGAVRACLVVQMLMKQLAL